MWFKAEGASEGIDDAFYTKRKYNKTKHIFLVSIFHDENENLVSTKVIQGPIKKDWETAYIVEDNGDDYWAPKNIFKKFEVVKDSYLSEGCEKPAVHYNMGFIWEDGADKRFIQHMADECQRQCKLPVVDRMNELRNEIDKSIDKLLKAKTCVKI